MAQSAWLFIALVLRKSEAHFGHIDTMDHPGKCMALHSACESLFVCCNISNFPGKCGLLRVSVIYFMQTNARFDMPVWLLSKICICCDWDLSIYLCHYVFVETCMLSMITQEMCFQYSNRISVIKPWDFEDETVPIYQYLFFFNMLLCPYLNHAELHLINHEFSSFSLSCQVSLSSIFFWFSRR